MKEIEDVEQLQPKIYETVVDPAFSVSIGKFCDIHSVSDKSLRSFIETKVTDTAFGSISIGDCIYEISNVLELELKDEENDVFTLILDLYNDDTLSEILQYDVNQNSETTRKLFNIRSQQKTILVSTENKRELPRDPEVVQSKLLQVLAPFNLHVDESGIVAHEVERYLKGEILSRDLAPHLSAMLDKPLSEINTLVASLNEQIFKPIQRQIAEEGTLDISYDDDRSLQNFLVVSKNKTPEAAPTVSKKVDVRDTLGQISFLPKEVMKNVSQQQKDDVVSDLRAQGGTPSGASLLSQEVAKEQFTHPKRSQKVVDIVGMPKYTIDPYRENI